MYRDKIYHDSKMGKAKTFGGAAVVFGLIMGVLSYFLVHSVAEQSFTKFLLFTYLPVLLVTLGLVAIVIGVLLLIYG
jgi:hypothetical protein